MSLIQSLIDLLQVIFFLLFFPDLVWGSKDRGCHNCAECLIIDMDLFEESGPIRIYFFKLFQLCSLTACATHHNWKVIYLWRQWSFGLKGHWTFHSINVSAAQYIVAEQIRQAKQKWCSLMQRMFLEMVNIFDLIILSVFSEASHCQNMQR